MLHGVARLRESQGAEQHHGGHQFHKHTFHGHTSPVVELLWIRRPNSAGPGMRCGERMKVTLFRGQKSRRSKKKAAIRFSLMAAIKEARGKLDLRKRE
jgi:hypothetical protein